MTKSSYSVTKFDEDIPTLCELSEEYRRWEMLPPVERSKHIQPPMCKVEEEQPYHFFSFDLQSSYPSTYNSRSYGYVPSVKDQEDTGTCWAFATTTILETFLKKNQGINTNFSTRHMEYFSTRQFANGQINPYGYNRALDGGGTRLMASNYLINNYGPVNYASMPFENNTNPISLSQVQNKTVVYDVNNINLTYGTSKTKCTSSQIDSIKAEIMATGAVSASIYMTTSSSYYNSSTHALMYNGSSDTNHAITIVGWNDNYSRTNFSSSNRPVNGGAWIVQNSYGPTWGNNGLFYVSYEDARICNTYMSIHGVDSHFDDNHYSYDPLGYNAGLGYNTTTAYAMNVFDRKGSSTQLLKEVTFGTRDTGSYEIYYYPGDGSTVGVSNMTKIGSGVIPYSGYITHKLTEEILISSSKFSIVIYYKSNTNTKPIAVSTNRGDHYKYVTTSAGHSFCSSSGRSGTWTDYVNIGDTVYINSIKADTENASNYIRVNGYTIDYTTSGSMINLQTDTLNINPAYLAFRIINGTNYSTPISNTYTTSGNKITGMHLQVGSSITGSVGIEIYYNGSLMTNYSVNINPPLPQFQIMGSAVSYGSPNIITLYTSAKNFHVSYLYFDIVDSNGTRVPNLGNNLTYNGDEIVRVDFGIDNSYYGDFYIKVYIGVDMVNMYPVHVNPPVSPTITSSVYRIDETNKYIYVPEKTSFTTFINNINNGGTSVQYNGTSYTSGIIKTKMTVKDYTIIVIGDVTSDGYVKMNDVIKISQYLVEGNGLDTIYKKAADVTGDGYNKMNDVIKISKYLVEGGSL